MIQSRSRAIRAAQRILEGLSKRTLPIVIYDIAKNYAFMQRNRLADDVSAMLIPTPSESRKRWIIVVNKNHSPERQNFSMAHELGHLVLHAYKTPHADGVQKVRFRNSESSLGTDRDEIEANQFAAEILMPAKLLIPRLQELGLGAWDGTPSKDISQVIETLASECRVSEQALVLRIGNLLHRDERY